MLDIFSFLDPINKAKSKQHIKAINNITAAGSAFGFRRCKMNEFSTNSLYLQLAAN